LKLSSATSIIEVAPGTGGGLKLCNFLKPKSAKLTAMDISPAMLSYASKKVDDPSVTFVEGNAEKLPFEDKTFDRYYAAFCLHLVTDPDQMLREAYRVMQDNSIAAFSVWGRAEKCTQITIFGKYCAELGIQLTNGPQLRSNFHIGVDIEATKKRALSVGFSKVLVWYSDAPLPLFSGEEYVAKPFSAPNNKLALSKIDPEKVEELRRRLTTSVDELISQGKPLGMENMYIVCVKGNSSF